MESNNPGLENPPGADVQKELYRYRMVNAAYVGVDMHLHLRLDITDLRRALIESNLENSTVRRVGIITLTALCIVTCLGFGILGVGWYFALPLMGIAIACMCMYGLYSQRERRLKELKAGCVRDENDIQLQRALTMAEMNAGRLIQVREVLNLDLPESDQKRLSLCEQFWTQQLEIARHRLLELKSQRVGQPEEKDISLVLEDVEGALDS